MSDSVFARACRKLATPYTPVWFMRQAGRYMAEYRAVRERYSLLEICQRPEVAADVTITAAEALGVDAAIIFADLLLPLEVMGMAFHFADGGPLVERPLRTRADIAALRTDRAAELAYVGEAIGRCVAHWGAQRPVIGFCGAPFTLASYMIEGGGSRHYLAVKRMMTAEPEAFDELLAKLNAVLSDYALAQVRAGANAIQVFDSWVGCLSPEDYRRQVLPRTRELVAHIRQTGVPVIYFGTDTATLLEAINETQADVIGLDWRTPLDWGWRAMQYRPAVQGNLDPAMLLAPWPEVERRARAILDEAGARAGHIFNVGHGILPQTPVETVKRLTRFVQEYSAELRAKQ